MFHYSDLTNPQQERLFDEVFDEEYSRDLAEHLFQRYRGQGVEKQHLLHDCVAWHPVCIT